MNARVYEQGLEVPGEWTWQQALSRALETEKTFAWLGWQDPEKKLIEEVGHTLGLHDLVMEDAAMGGQMAKLEEYSNYLFIVCPQAKKLGNSIEYGEVGIIVNPKQIVTFRKGAGDGFTSVRERVKSEPQLLKLGSGFVLYTLLDTMVDRYFPIVKFLEREFQALEESVFEPESIQSRDSVTKNLYHLRREVVKFRGVVEPLLEVTIKLFGGRVASVFEGLGDYFRDVHDHLTRIVARLDALYDAIGSAVQAHLALTTIEESKITKKLAAYASIFAVDTLWVGLWGMNFKHMPELEWTYGYAMALSILGVTTTVLFRMFKKKGWI